MTFDSEQRRRAVEETNRSFIVEASAGTGKTSTLTSRILHLVLEKGPSGPPVRLSQICAITFTEKAAGEMKIRLRQKFEEIAASDSAAAQRAREALLDVEAASISTFHSFAVSLLKERPIEAGLDPHFTALDEIRSELFFRDAWDSWISRALAERAPLLERALRTGISLSSLQELAGTLRKSGHAVRALTCDAPMTDADAQERIRQLLEDGRSCLEQNRGKADRLLEHLERSMEWLKNPGPECPPPSKPRNSGSRANWNGGESTIEHVREFIREVVEFCDDYAKLPVQRLLREILDWIATDFISAWQNRKKEGGLLDFDDQLWLARDLLLRSKAVRSEFQARYATLLVDEFQDTDPVQWDIVRLLSSSDVHESDTAKIVPGPGRLFIVGDPKQSIYRFRGADIETYLEIADPLAMHQLGLERLQLTTNFRSVPSILRFADAAFPGVMRLPDEGRYQPDYLPFGNEGDRQEEPDPPSVHFLGERKREGGFQSVREFAECEASRIAALIGEIAGSAAWKIQDGKGQKGWRVPRFGDIAILLPVLSRADALEDALRDREIPYVLEGGKFYYMRSEVSSAITALRAAANPNDSVALYGALRSIFFGISDEDLLRARMQGQKLDYRARVPEESPLSYPFEVLLDLHLKRHARRASETLEILLQRTGAREVLAARGLQSVANLNKLARTLRSLQGEATFSQVVELLGTMDEEGLAESESRLMEERSDAVRILTIHKSKGLDFPIVFVAGLGLEKKTQSKNLIADLHKRKIFAVSIGSQKTGLQSPGWKTLAEEDKKKENAELVRLLYVALTRARDHLILSTHTKDWSVSQGQWIPDTKGTRLSPLGPILENNISRDTGQVRWIDVQKLDLLKKPRQSSFLSMTQDWEGALQREYADLRAILQSAPSSRSLFAAGRGAVPAEQEVSPREARPEEMVGNRAVRLGIAFHEAMERVDLFSCENPGASLRELAHRHSLDIESASVLEQMVETALSSELLAWVRRNAASGSRVLRELPFVRPLGGGVEEGKIDLLFEDGDGWVLVDYKTDWVASQKMNAETHFREKYAGQIRQYVEALQELPVEIRAAYLLLARTGESIRIL